VYRMSLNGSNDMEVGTPPTAPDPQGQQRNACTTAGGDYYRQHGLDQDRIALWYYARVLHKLRPGGGRLLDFGCGSGHLLRRLSDRFETYGYDVSAYARATCQAIAPDTVVLQDWMTLELSGLDVVVALHTLEHLESPLPVMEGLSARLRPSGLFFFVVPNSGGLGRRLKGEGWFAYRDPTHRSLLTRDQWSALAQQAGLHVKWVRGDGMWDAPYVRSLPVAVQRILFGAPAALQMVSPLRRPFLPAFLGECLIFACVKSAGG
jgi:SAM-dependent methyltransferase